MDTSAATGYGDKRVEVIGADYVVARGEDGKVWFAEVAPERLGQYRTPPDEGDG